MRRSKANAHGPARTEIVVDMGTGLRGDDTILIAAVENPARTLRQIARQPATAAESMIDRIVAAIPDADNDFVLMFSSVAFARHQFRLDWRRSDGSATGTMRRTWVSKAGCVLYSRAIFRERRRRSASK